MLALPSCAVSVLFYRQKLMLDRNGIRSQKTKVMRVRETIPQGELHWGDGGWKWPDQRAKLTGMKGKRKIALNWCNSSHRVISSRNRVWFWSDEKSTWPGLTGMGGGASLFAQQQNSTAGCVRSRETCLAGVKRAITSTFLKGLEEQHGGKAAPPWRTLCGLRRINWCGL